MEVIHINREDFLIYRQNIIYLDNAATTLKPKILGEATSDYYNNYSANINRGDYDLSFKVAELYEGTRKLIGRFLGADEKEIVFTNNATDALNKIVMGFFEERLHEGDEVLLTKSEHASNVLPWFELAKRKGIVIKYAPLDENLRLTLDNLKDSITPRTKVISIAHITNVVGDIRPIKEITALAHDNNIIVVCDGAQSVPHMKVNVHDLGVDFLVFSAHKMCGPTALGILYGKMEYLKMFKPIIVGGGMNASYDSDGTVEYNDIPYYFEAGTPNIAEVIAFGRIIEYLENIGMDKINLYINELKEYAIKELKTVPSIILYNEDSDTGIITLNMKDIFAQDLAIYLNKYNICVRAGAHCSKLLKDDLGVKNTCRISLYFYNTKQEIDILVSTLKNDNIINEII